MVLQCIILIWERMYDIMHMYLICVLEVIQIKSRKLYYVIYVVISFVIVASSLVYLIAQKTIPGLTPTSLALLMLLMLLNDGITNNKKSRKALFLIAGVLNILLGILQIVIAVVI